MTKEKPKKKYSFKNNFITYKSYINGFGDKNYKEFDLKSESIGLQSKIEDLMNNKKTNFTEDKAASHPQLRKSYSLPNFGLQEFADINDPPELYARDVEWDSSISKEDPLTVQHDFSGISKKYLYKNIIILGIGGSYEGPKLLLESLRDPHTSYHYEFITGSDREEFNYKTSFLKPEETCFFVSSKSFKTDETIENLKNAIKWSGDMDNFIAITSNKSEAEKYGIKQILEFNNEIGGRYSIWSLISQPVMAGTSGEFFSFNEGGHQADKDFLENKEYLGFIKYLSFSDIWLNNEMNINSRAVLSYIWRLRSFPNYVQQLEMESLGKPANKNSEFKNTGQIIFGGYGPTAQHSYFQLLHQGTQNICADIIASNEDSKSLAFAQALTQARLLSDGADDLLKEEEEINGNVPLNLFLLNKIDAYTLGYLIASWEHRTYTTAVMLQINPFDQFGVSAGKIYTKKYLRENGA